MGLFHRKQKPSLQQPLPAVPRFQREQPYPRYENQLPQKPPMQQEFPDIHGPVEYVPDEEVPQPAFTVAQPKQQTQLLSQAPDIAQPQLDELPQRQPAFMRPRYPQREAFANTPVERRDLPLQKPDPAISARKSFASQPQMQPSMAREISPRKEEMQQSATEDKPIFVKIGQYREAVAHVDLVKKDIQEVENLLVQLEAIRSQEQNEIDTAKKSLEAVKEKLLNIDKQLFEV